jgi:hypothetical protein
MSIARMRRFLSPLDALFDNIINEVAQKINRFLKNEQEIKEEREHFSFSLFFADATFTVTNTT